MTRPGKNTRTVLPVWRKLELANEKTLSQSDILKLREKDILTKDEIALLVGDIVIAENVITKQRRTIETSGLLLEANRRILKD